MLIAVLLAVMGLSALTTPRAEAATVGGPVILGGDDLTDHGGYDGTTQTNTEGWLYIEKAIANIKPHVTRPGADGSIAALGSADPNFDVNQSYFGDAGAAIASAGVKNSMPVSYYADDAAIGAFFDALRAGTLKPSIIWIAGDNASNDLGSNGGATALSSNATTIGDFVNSGGGLMSHGTEYGWLGGVLPGVSGNGCNGGSSDDLELTAEGLASFPGLTNADVNAGPWHACFEGDIGDLDILVKSTGVQDAAGNPGRVIIGGAAVTLPGSIDLTPATATNPVSTSHTVTATVRNGDGSLASGITVSFSVTAGPDSGATGTGTTDANGQATYTYTNNGTAGTDTIVASYTANGTVHTATASKTWEAGAANRAPVIDSDPATVQYSDALVPAQLATATDPDSNPLTMTSSALPASLSGTDDGSGGFDVGGTATAVPGVYPVTYTADDGTDTSTSVDNITITKEDCTLSAPLSVQSSASGNTSLTATLGEPDSSVGDLSGKTISWSGINAGGGTVGPFTATTNSAGVATALTGLGEGVYSLTASFAGDSYYLGCQAANETVVAVAPANYKVTGGGWISQGTGKTTFGFNAKQDVSGLRGQLQIRTSSKSRFHGNVVLTLSGTANTATWTGTGKWNGVAGYKFVVSVVDNGTSGKRGDTISIVVRAPNNSVVFSTSGASPLKGGNIVVRK